MLESSWSRRAALSSAIGLAGMAALTGCGLLSHGLELSADDQLDAAITSLWEEGGTQRIDELVAVQFDALFIFPDGTSAEIINRAAGLTVVRGEQYTNSTQLFLFVLDGAAVRASMVSPDVLDSDAFNTRFGPEATLVAQGGQELVTVSG